MAGHTFPTPAYAGRQTTAPNGSIYEFKPVHGWTHIGGPPADEFDLADLANGGGDGENAAFTSTEAGLDATTIGDAINENRRELALLTGSGSEYDASADDIDVAYTYQAFHKSTDDTWISFRCSLSTGDAAGTATGAGAIPLDLTSLTYVI